jgi:hypothetical protein
MKEKIKIQRSENWGSIHDQLFSLVFMNAESKSDSMSIIRRLSGKSRKRRGPNLPPDFGKSCLWPLCRRSPPFMLHWYDCEEAFFPRSLGVYKPQQYIVPSPFDGGRPLLTNFTASRFHLISYTLSSQKKSRRAFFVPSFEQVC